MSTILNGELVSVPVARVVECRSQHARDRRTNEGGWVVRCDACKTYFVEGDPEPCRKHVAQFMHQSQADRRDAAQVALTGTPWTVRDLQDALREWQPQVEVILSWLEGTSRGIKKADVAAIAADLSAALEELTA